MREETSSARQEKEAKPRSHCDLRVRGGSALAASVHQSLPWMTGWDVYAEVERTYLSIYSAVDDGMERFAKGCVNNPLHFIGLLLAGGLLLEEVVASRSPCYVDWLECS